MSKAGLPFSHPTIIAVVNGGCRSIEVVSDCGHRYSGADFAGTASFIPAGVTRHITMRDVRSEWASLSIQPDLFTLADEHGGAEPQEQTLQSCEIHLSWLSPGK